MEVKIKKLHKDAVIPSYALNGDAGMDLTAVSCEWDSINEFWSCNTGLAFEMPEGYVGLLFPRSSIFKKNLTLSNSVGVLDSGYRGEVKFKFKEVYSIGEAYYSGERIGQIIIMPYPKIEFKEVTELSDSERGIGGYGSTGN